MFKEIFRVSGVIFRRIKTVIRLRYEYFILNRTCNIYNSCEDCPFSTEGHSSDCTICHERGLISSELNYYKKGN